MERTMHGMHGFEEKYDILTGAKSRLPEGVEHGSARAAIRHSCACDECMERRARIRARRNGVRR